MKFVYLLEFRQLMKKSNQFELYQTYAFSSLRKIESAVMNIIENNQGIITDNDYMKPFDDQIKIVEYKCLSTDLNWIKMRLILVKKQIQ
tara:strand:+ start:71525 stop:71791 length:267 start_codon:yes stop_codon:yes gene_type:complete